jgi:uncharacterized protein (DUF1786 family)
MNMPNDDTPDYFSLRAFLFGLFKSDDGQNGSAWNSLPISTYKPRAFNRLEATANSNADENV